MELKPNMALEYLNRSNIEILAQNSIDLQTSAPHLLAQDGYDDYFGVFSSSDSSLTVNALSLAQRKSSSSFVVDEEPQNQYTRTHKDRVSLLSTTPFAAFEDDIVDYIVGSTSRNNNQKVTDILEKERQSMIERKRIDEQQKLEARRKFLLHENEPPSQELQNHSQNTKLTKLDDFDLMYLGNKARNEKISTRSSSDNTHSKPKKIVANITPTKKEKKHFRNKYFTLSIPVYKRNQS